MRFDHAIIAVFDLEVATTDFEELGFTVVYGGKHDGGLTHNALITFKDGTYFEVMAPTDPGLLENPPDPGPGNYLFLFECGEGFAGYVLHTDELEVVVDRVRQRGIRIADPEAGGRIRADGVKLAWRTAFPQGSVSPFFITDKSPREFRVRTEPELTSHANGAIGIERLSIVVSNLEAGIARHSILLGEDPVRSDAIEGIETVAFRVGAIEATLAAPVDSASPLANHLSRRGEGLYQVAVGIDRPANEESFLAHGARIRLVGT